MCLYAKGNLELGIPINLYQIECIFQHKVVLSNHNICLHLSDMATSNICHISYNKIIGELDLNSSSLVHYTRKINDENYIV